MAAKKRTTNKKKKTFQISKSTMDSFVDKAIAEHHFTTNTIAETTAIVLNIIEDAEIKDIANSITPEEVEKAYSKLKANISSFAIDDSTTITDLINTINADRNNADKNYALAKNDIVEIWSAAIYGKNSLSILKSWIADPTYGEKFTPFSEKGERFIYSGYKNQMLLASALEYGTEVNITVTKTDIENIVNENFQPELNSEKTEADQKKSNFFSAIKGKPSISSIYVPKIYEHYYMPDGSRWKSDNPKMKKPTPEQIKSQKISVHENVSYLSTPVWSIEQFKDYLSQEKMEAFEQLKRERMPKSFVEKLTANKSDDADDLAKVIDKKIQNTAKEQSIEIIENSTSNHYLPAKDKIYILESDRFLNPVLRYRTFMHEIGHSTKHILGRKVMKNSEVQEGQLGIMEEIVAESIAYLATKTLERDLRKELGDNFPLEWDRTFSKAFQANNAYINSHANDQRIKESFREFEDQVRDGDFSLLEDVIKHVIQAQQLIHNGTYFGKEITKELRVKSLKENYKKWDSEKIKSASAFELS